MAGRIAKQSQILNGGIVGGINVIFGFLFYAYLHSLPHWYTIGAFVSIVPMAMVGGYLARKRQEKVNDVQPMNPPDKI